MLRSRFVVIIAVCLLACGCVNVQTLPALKFSVRVLDLGSGAPISDAQVILFLSSGVSHVPDIQLGPIPTDSQGIARVISAEQKLQIRGFDHNWAGGFGSWPWIRVEHPDYETSGYSMPQDTEREVSQKGEVVFRVRKKRPNKALEPTTTAGTSAAKLPRVPAAVVAHL